MFAYVGSRTTRERNARGDGISVYRCAPATGALELIQIVGGLINPSFLALNKAGDRLYAVHGDCEDISSFVVDRSTGRIDFLNRQSTQGKNPVHLALDPTGRFVVVSNHITSSLAVLGIQANGAIGSLTQLIKLEGEPGPHRKEQPFPKPHFNPFDPSGQFVVVPDKGLDKTFVFRFKDGQLCPGEFPCASGREASGPRHLAFHPNQPWAYIANELDSTVTACRFDANSGELKPIQIISGLAETFVGNSRSSEIEVDRAGRTLYVSNRGEDTIGVFRIDQSDGRLTLIQSQPSAGKTPRFFVLSKDGRWLYVLNEESDSIIVFAVDPDSGKLRPTERKYQCGSPVCMVLGA